MLTHLGRDFYITFQDNVVIVFWRVDSAFGFGIFLICELLGCFVFHLLEYGRIGTFFSVVCSNGHKLNDKKYLNMTKNFLMLRVSDHWNRLPMGLWSLPLCRLSKPSWMCPCVTCPGLPCLGRGGGQDDVQKSLPTLPVLWFFEKVISYILKTSYFAICFLERLADGLIIEVLWRMCFITWYHSIDVKQNDMVVTFASDFCRSVVVTRVTRKPMWYKEILLYVSCRFFL